LYFLESETTETMDAEETKAAAAVMIAWAEGNKIQYKSKSSQRDIWTYVSEPIWDFDYLDYRIAPEPIEVEVWVHKDGRIAGREAMSCDVAEKCGWTLRRTTIYPEQP
jgi:hypothetical protein